MRIEHTVPAGLLDNRRVRVLVVGAGGTGSAIVMGLPYLDQAMRAWRHRGGLDVWMMDADTVSETNCIRQPFSYSDLGLNKATVLINRINLFWGTEWKAFPIHLDKRARIQDTQPDIVIGCVDTRAARRAIEEALKTSLKPHQLLARSRQQRRERSVHSRPTFERAESQKGRAPAYSKRTLSRDHRCECRRRSLAKLLRD